MNIADIVFLVISGFLLAFAYPIFMRFVLIEYNAIYKKIKLIKLKKMKMSKKEIIERLDRIEIELYSQIKSLERIEKIIKVKEIIKLENFTNEILKNKFLNTTVTQRIDDGVRCAEIKQILDDLYYYSQYDFIDSVIIIYCDFINKQKTLNQYLKQKTESKRKVGRPRKEK